MATKTKTHQQPHVPLFAGLIASAGLAFAYLTATAPLSVNATQCQALPEPYGSAALEVNIPADGSYRLWARMYAPDASRNSFYLDVETAGECHLVVGDSPIEPGQWTWVGYEDGDHAKSISLTLNKGAHRFKLTGREAGVKIDKLLLVSDPACVPEGAGENCAVNPPAELSVNGLSDNQVLTGDTAIKAEPMYAQGVTKVEFLIDGIIRNVDRRAPYCLAGEGACSEYDIGSLPMGDHTLDIYMYYGGGEASLRKTVSFSSATLRHPDGQFVRDPNGPNVYRIEGGVKRHVSDPWVLMSYLGAPSERVRFATPADLALADGAPLVYREGTLVRGANAPHVYVIDHSETGARKRHIASLEAFTSLGYSGDEVIVAPESSLPAGNGPPINASLHPDNTFVKDPNSPTVYLVSDGAKRHVTNPYMLMSFMGTPGNRVRAATPADLGLSNGPALSSYREGVLIRTENDHKVYVIDQNGDVVQKRHVATLEAFILLGYLGSDIMLVPTGNIPFDDGQPIDR